VPEGVENLGKASLDLEANVVEFERNMREARGSAERMERQLEGIATFSRIAEEALHQVKMHAGQGAASRASAEGILSGVRGISEASLHAAHELDRVRLDERQATESAIAGERIERRLEGITRKGNEARRSLESVRIVGGLPGRTGVGVGPFGSGFGRIGVVGAAVGLGALTAPAAGPAAVGLLAGIPTLAAAGAGAIGTLVLAFQNVGKAIGGDKKAFDELSPAAQRFVQTVRGLHGWLDRLKQTAATSLFPGLTAGLRAALSPGTVNAISTAVGELGRALGAAGLQWGRYFGSPRFQQLFGPLMRAGARTIGVLSDALLHLFDALGVIGRAAIPFMDWFNLAIDRGARLADTWLRTQAASGGLARGMNEAKTSLRLVGGLALALLRAVGALGRALYPLAKVAVKVLTDGLNALAGIINRNRGAIRAIAGAALTGFVTVVKVAAGAIRLLVNGLSHIVGHKNAVIATITGIGLALAVAFSENPFGAIAVAAIIAIGVIKKHWGGIVRFFRTLNQEIRNAFRWLWVQLERGAIYAALKMIEPFSHLPSFLGGWARKAKKAMQHQLDSLHPPNMDWSAAAAQAGYRTGKAWATGFDAAAKATGKSKRELIIGERRQEKKVDINKLVGEYRSGKLSRAEVERKLHAAGVKGRLPFNLTPPALREYLEGLTLEQIADAFDLPIAAPPLPKKTAAAKPAKPPKPPKPLKPGSHAWWIKNYGYDPNDLTTFGPPPPFTTPTGPGRKKKHRGIGAIAKSHLEAAQEKLNLALDRAKVAVENAKEGTKAYDRAVAAEERALRAEIRYWDKRAHNLKLSMKARDKALRAELKYKHELNDLHKHHLHKARQLKGVAENEAQFLSSFAQIISAFAPNAFPVQAGGGKTDTHLYEIKHEARRTNRHLHEIKRQSQFPATANGLAAAGAVAG
jgi:hypothetical protein